jgi:hypothetical protein
MKLQEKCRKQNSEAKLLGHNVDGLMQNIKKQFKPGFVILCIAFFIKVAAKCRHLYAGLE